MFFGFKFRTSFDSCEKFIPVRIESSVGAFALSTANTVPVLVRNDELVDLVIGQTDLGSIKS